MASDGYCIEKAWDRSGMVRHPCSKKAKHPAEDPKYCGTHDPDKIAKRRAKAEAKWKAESDASDRRSRMDSLAHQCVKLLSEGKFTEAWKVADEWKALREGRDIDA